MAQPWKLIVAYSLSIVCALLLGCNRGASHAPAPAAAIEGQSAGQSASSNESAPAATKKHPSDLRHPVVQIETSLGNITIRLDGEKTPLTVGNFLSYVDSAYYDQTIVHQVYKGQGLVGGGFGTNRLEKVTRTPVRNEAHNGLKNRRGTISMVPRPDAIDSATSQFFINVADNDNLDFKDRTPDGYGYCVFGEVIEGIEVVDKINDAAVHDTADFERTPVEPIVVASIRRIR